MSDAALDDLRRAGFSFVRLPVQPEFLSGAMTERLQLLADAVGRLQRHGFGVIVEVHPTTWHLETSAADRAQLLALWRQLAPLLARFDPRVTFPEVVNEPVFAHDSAGWEALQQEALAVIRVGFPAATVVLTGNDWGDLDGLLRLHPVADPNVIYSFHFYEPTILTTLASFEPALDTPALATLPFPVAEPCVRGGASGRTASVMRYYCSGQWDEAHVRARIALAAEWAHRNHAAVLAGEFGADSRLNEGARLAWMAAVRRAAADQGLGWALWGYDDFMGFNIARSPPSRPRLDPNVLRALGLAG